MRKSYCNKTSSLTSGLSLDVEALAVWQLRAITTGNKDILGNKCLDVVLNQNWLDIKLFMREG